MVQDAVESEEKKENDRDDIESSANTHVKAMIEASCEIDGVP